MTNSNEVAEARAMLKALVKACKELRRQNLRSEGMEERDLAFEANLIAPLDMDMPRYAQIKRGAIERVLEQMKSQGLIEFINPRPGTLYRVVPTPNGEEIGESLARPWYQRLLDTLLRRRTG